MSMRLTTAFVLCAGMALSGCARVENIAREGLTGADHSPATHECILVGRITAGCRPIIN